MTEEIKIERIYYPKDIDITVNPEESFEIYIKLSNEAVVNLCGGILPYLDKTSGASIFSTDLFMGVIEKGSFNKDDFKAENWDKIKKEIATSILRDFNGEILDDTGIYYDEPTKIKIRFTDFSLDDIGNENKPVAVQQEQKLEHDTQSNSEKQSISSQDLSSSTSSQKSTLSQPEQQKMNKQATGNEMK